MGHRERRSLICGNVPGQYPGARTCCGVSVGGLGATGDWDRQRPLNGLENDERNGAFTRQAIRSCGSLKSGLIQICDVHCRSTSGALAQRSGGEGGHIASGALAGHNRCALPDAQKASRQCQAISAPNLSKEA